MAESKVGLKETKRYDPHGQYLKTMVLRRYGLDP